MVESSSHRLPTRKQLGVARCKYYLWKRTYAEGGLEALDDPHPKWNNEEDRLLITLSKSDLPTSAICERIPTRSPKAVSERLRTLGISLTEERKAFRTNNGKTCSCCGERKPFSEFYPAAYESIDGHLSLCKSCFLKKCEHYREENRDSINAKARLYRDRLRKEDPKHFTEYQRVYRRTARGTFMTLKQRCSSNPNRKALFRLNWEQFKTWFNAQSMKCYYCGITLSEYLRIRHKLPGRCPSVETLTVDRIDSRLPYQEVNIMLSCYLCNYLKGYAFNESAFLEIARQYIVPHLLRLGASIE